MPPHYGPIKPKISLSVCGSRFISNNAWLSRGDRESLELKLQSFGAILPGRTGLGTIRRRRKKGCSQVEHLSWNCCSERKNNHYDFDDFLPGTLTPMMTQVETRIGARAMRGCWDPTPPTFL
jgi:hypothetical protein